MSAELYYTPSTDVAFEEVKAACISIWETMGAEPSYSEGKIAQIADLENVGDNFMYMIAMFDVGRQREVLEKVSAETIEQFKARLIDGGTSQLDILMWYGI